MVSLTPLDRKSAKIENSLGLLVRCPPSFVLRIPSRLQTKMISMKNRKRKLSVTAKCCLIPTMAFLTSARFSEGLLPYQRTRVLSQRGFLTTRQRRCHPSFFVSHQANDDRTIPSSLPDDNRTEKLWSYVYSLQNARKESRDLRPAKSLIAFLSHNPILTPTESEQHNQACERAMIQAIRSAGEMGDYRLILGLLDAGVLYANNHPVLAPKVFGEALQALSKTKANISKLKHVWNLISQGNEKYLQSYASPFELNSILKALASRGKTRACLDLYHRHVVVDDRNSSVASITADAYTASTIFSLLTESIKNGQTECIPERIMVSEGASEFQKSMARLTYSTCWQWNAAVELLDTLPSESEWNNFVFSTFLKLQDRSHEVSRGHRNSPLIALAVLDSMMELGVDPDELTCTLAIKAMGDPRVADSWKLAIKLLDQMKIYSSLPDPNVYSYSAAIMACARCHEYDTALALLDEMKSGAKNEAGFVPPKPNTWVYNTVLSALADGKEYNNHQNLSKRSKIGLKKKSQYRTRQALKLLAEMKEQDVHAPPDIVTYNTILGILGSNCQKSDTKTNGKVFALLDEMAARKVDPDIVSYRRAMRALTTADDVLKAMDIALNDLEEISLGSQHKKKETMLSLFNSALLETAKRGSLPAFVNAFSMMYNREILPNADTISHTIRVLGQTGHGRFIPTILLPSEKRQTSTPSLDELAAATNLNLSLVELPKATELEYANAISVCLEANDLVNAQEVFKLMKDQEIKPTDECLLDFAMSYARLAIKTSPKKSRSAKIDLENGAAFTASQARAQSAFTVVTSLETKAPLNLLSAVARACSVTNLWNECRTIVRTIHKRVLESRIAEHDIDVEESLEKLSTVHRSLLCECAVKGNITAALWLVKDIQKFSKKLRSARNVTSINESDFLETSVSLVEDDIMSPLHSLLSSNATYSTRVDLKPEDWTFVMKAASTSGHWRVCVNTLQFLRPFLEKYHPNKIAEENKVLVQTRYNHLAPALTAATICLERKGQYAWSLKAVDDWMEWSGRRPLPEAVLAVVRILSARGRGDEAISLLKKCIEQSSDSDIRRKGVTYEEMLYIGTITSLHKNGLYDSADEAFVAGISEGHLPFDFNQTEEVSTLDLHGLNVALAHSSVRVALRKQAIGKQENEICDLMFVTGRGRNSELRMTPVLRPEVQRMLSEEFYPPLNTVSVPGNMGALKVFSNDIAAWQHHQEEQKGARLLALAATLKNLSSVDRIRKSIEKKIQSPSPKEDLGNNGSAMDEVDED